MQAAQGKLVGLEEVAARLRSSREEGQGVGDGRCEAGAMSMHDLMARQRVDAGQECGAERGVLGTLVVWAEWVMRVARMR